MDLYSRTLVGIDSTYAVYTVHPIDPIRNLLTTTSLLKVEERDFWSKIDFVPIEKS